MTIAIDLDNTWTADLVLWRVFYEHATKSRGHRVIMVTARRDMPSVEERARYCLPIEMPIFCTAGDFKEQHVRRAGIKVDVWIDDAPGMIQECPILRTSPDNHL